MDSNLNSRKSRVRINVKRTAGKLKITRDAVKALDSEKEDRRGRKKTSFRNYNDDSSNVVSSDGYLRRKERKKGVRDLKLEVKDKSPNYKSQKRDYQKDDGKFGSRNLVSLDRKRKRVYDGPEMGKGKHSYGEESSELRNVSVKEVKTIKGKSFGLNHPKNSKSLEAGTRSIDKHSFDGVVSKLRTKVKVDGKFERFGCKTLEKKNGYGKFDKSKGFDLKGNKQSAESAGKFLKRNTQVKKAPVTDSAEDFRPRKKKKLMRIDRHDISNKRIDDGLISEGNTIKGNKGAEENVQMSKNAQFRAIIPSPSILSFVEDNLLGRRRLNDIRKAGYNCELSVPLDNIPSSTSLERERIEDPIFRNKLEFFAAAKVSSSFPPPNLPEVAFAGRSNVGKSSLLNALTRQWGVVRTSDKPGLTQTINFFNLGTKLCLVDLPGYGFAYAKDEVKESWEELVKEYVSTRVGLKRVCLLIDTKWGMKPRDYELISLMERYKTKYQIVLTKTDAVFPIDVARRATQIEETLKKNTSIVQPAVMVSSKSGAGIRSLRAALTKIARFAKL